MAHSLIMVSSLRTRLLVVLVVAVGCIGCGGTNAWRERPHDPGNLDLPPGICPRTGGRATTASWRLALPGGLDPTHAPLPATEAERHVFRNLYETLVRVDCAGRVESGLADTWEAYDDGRFWVFRIRAGARFWDGSPVDPEAVMLSWRQAESLCRLRGEPTPFLHFDPRSALQVLGPRELGIRLRTANDQLPLALVHPALAVTGGAGTAGWPLGSGPCRPTSAPSAQRLLLVPHDDHPDRPTWQRLEIVLDQTLDPRELLDLGIDGLVTRERDILGYYAGRRGTAYEALPWDRWYYLITPTDDRRWTSGWDRLELAREVSTQTAEPAEFFAFEPARGICASLPPRVPVLQPPSLAGLGVRTSRDRDLVLWPASDPDAGRLAERLTVLAMRPLRPGPQRPSRGTLEPPVEPGLGVAPESVAVPNRDLTRHVQSGRAGAVVLPWQRRFPTPCDELSRLLSLAEWLVDAGLEPGPSTRAIPPGATAANPMDDAEPPRALAVSRRLERDHAVQALIRSRAQLVRSHDLVGLSWDHDGALRLWSGGLR